MCPRKKLSASTEFEVLYHSARRCCICFGVNSDFDEKKGQLAHLDKDPTNDAIENIAWLCLQHHDIYDGRTSQSKGYSEEEVKQYRYLLYQEVIYWRERTSSDHTSEAQRIKQALIDQNIALFFYAALGANQPAIRSLLLNEIHDVDFKEQIINVWSFLDQKPNDVGIDITSSTPTRLDQMASYIGSSRDGQEDLKVLMGLAGLAISNMSETNRNEALFDLKNDTIRSGLLLLHKIKMSKDQASHE